MFARFRQSATGRLQVSIVEPRRVNGSIKQEHVASLGSIETPPSVRARASFWRQTAERLHNLSNRISEDERAKIYNAIRARIPMPTDDEIAADNAEAKSEELEAWDEVRRGWQDVSNLLTMKITAIEESLAKDRPVVAMAQEMAGDVEGIKSQIAQGKINAATSARARSEHNHAQLAVFAKMAGINRRNAPKEEPPPSQIEKYFSEKKQLPPQWWKQGKE